VPLTTHTGTIKQRNKPAFAAQFPEVIPDSCSNKIDAQCFETTATYTAQTIITLAKISFAGGRIVLNKSGNNMEILGLLERSNVQTERTAFLNNNLKIEQVRKTDTDKNKPIICAKIKIF